MRLAVVTSVPDPDVPNDDQEANLAAPVGMLFIKDTESKPTLTRIEHSGRIGVGLSLALRYEVFVRGELLLLDDDGREVGGRGRKPGKWGVGLKTFPLSDGPEALRQAVTLLQELAE